MSGYDLKTLNYHLDDVDWKILHETGVNRALLGEREPLVGDWVIMKDGVKRRFTHDWGAGIQVTDKFYQSGEHGRFNIHISGHASYSGGLDPAIAKDTLVDTGQVEPAGFWFFHHGEAKASNGVTATLLCRVFMEVTKN